MIRTIEAVVDASGNVRLLEDVHLPGPRRALVTILDDALRSEETALLSERALADWSWPEEDAAWEDPIVAEVRAARGALFAAADYDLEKLVRRLREEQTVPGHPVVTFPPRVPDRDAGR